MQYLNVTMDFSSKPRPKPIPETDYIEKLKFVLYDVEMNYIFLSINSKTANPNQVLIGEL